MTSEISSDSRKLMSAIFDGDESTVSTLLGNCTDGNMADYVNTIDGEGTSPLHLAVKRGCTKIVELLLNAGADVYAKDSCAQTPLITACISGDMTVVEALLDSFTVDAVKTEYINLSDASGRNAVYWAAEASHYDLVMLLVTLGGILTSDKQSTKTHLMMAIRKNDRLKLEQLLDCFLDGDSKATYVNIADKYGYTALVWASQKYNHEIVDLLIKSGSDLAPESEEKVENNPLHHAIFLGRKEVVRVLLDSFTNERCEARTEYVNVKSGCYGSSMLNFAAGLGRYEIVDILVQYGADITAVDNEGWTPLMSASHGGHVEVVEILLSSYNDEMEKANYVNHQDMDGCTAMSLAAGAGHDDVVELLIKSGGDINTKDIKLITPLAIASAHGKLEVVQVLLDSISDESEKTDYIDARWNTTDSTALSLAARTGRHDIVELFIKYGADPTIYSESVWTPLMGASQQGHMSLVKMILSFLPDEASKKVHVNLICTDSDRPAIYYATWGGHYDIVRLLLQYGANIIVYDKYQWSPLMRASFDGNLDVVKLLLDWLPDDERVRYEYINKCNINRVSALEMAQKNGHWDIVDLLSKSGALNNYSRRYRYNRPR